MELTVEFQLFLTEDLDQGKSSPSGSGRFSLKVKCPVTPLI